ncbi:MAG: hypothetical protein K2J78_04850, partial [Muribaculaceae bacterium]|nr:hypothetical protein [Muribaculaceae bacterium]
MCFNFAVGNVKLAEPRNMNVVSDAIKRQLLIINKLERAVTPVSADDLMCFLANMVWGMGFSYPEERRSRIRLLQRDIKSIEATFQIKIARVGKSTYHIVEMSDDKWLVTYKRLFADFDLLTALHPDTNINRHIIPERSRNRGSEYLYDILRS